MSDYLKTLRQKIGHDKVIHPAARILVEDPVTKHMLFVERRDNGKLGLPAGGLETEETIEACIRREVREETGLILGKIAIVGIATLPRQETVFYPNGDVVQYFTLEFYSDDFSGNLAVADPAEIKAAHFLDAKYLTQLPPNEYSTVISWGHWRERGEVRLM